MNEYVELINFLNHTNQKYGEDSNASLIVKVSILIYLIENDLPNEQKKYLNQIIKHYNNSPQQIVNPQKTITINNEILYEFEDSDNQFKLSKNSNKFKTIDKSIVAINTYEDFSKLKNNNWYIYVVNKDNKLLILNAPQNTTQLVLGRKSDIYQDTECTHPLLLIGSKKFYVKTAGEIYITKDTNTKLNLIINNRSGHFKPNVESMIYLEKKLNKLGISNNNIYKIGANFPQQ